MWSGRLFTSSGRVKNPSVPGPMLSTPFSVAWADALKTRVRQVARRSEKVGLMFGLIVIGYVAVGCGRSIRLDRIARWGRGIAATSDCTLIATARFQYSSDHMAEED
ncbi:hypothetical protein D9M69_430170 [compost metagenome]